MFVNFYYLLLHILFWFSVTVLRNICNKMYLSGTPSSVISLENETLTCSSSGYPLPTILWYTCPGVQDTYVPTRLTV